MLNMKYRALQIIILTFAFIFFPLTALAKTNVAVVGSSTFDDGCIGSKPEKNNVTNGFVMQLKKALPDYNFTCFAKLSTNSTYFLEQFTMQGGVANNGFKELILYAGLNGLENTTVKNQADLDKIITEAKKEGMRIIGVGAQPFKGWGAWTPLWSENLKKNNAWFKTKVDIYIDYAALIDKNGDDAIDTGLGNNALHTNDAGHALLFKAVMSAAYGKDVPLPASAPKNNPVVTTDPKALEYGIGKQCKNWVSNSDCPNKLDCEDSDLDGANANICVCNKNVDCENAYGKSTADETWECKNDGGIDDAHALHFCVGSVQGTKYPISIEAYKTAPATDATASSDVAHAIKNTSLSEDELRQLLQKPQPKIKIPGLNFSDITIEGELSGDDLGNTYLNIPFLGEYLAAVYKYLVVIAGIFCLVRIIIGGFLFTIPDTSGNSKSSGKNMIVQAVTGLLISSTSYVILFTINPELVQFRNLKVLYARQADFTQYINQMNSNGTLVSDTNFHHNSIPAKASGKITNQNIADLAEKLKIDACYAWAWANKESGNEKGGASTLILGGDEGYQNNNKPVLARKKFLMSGVTYKGVAFTPMNESQYDLGGKKYWNNYPASPKKTGGGQSNDDLHYHGGKTGNDFSNPPDYDIDWRFSHGFFMGITIFPEGGGFEAKKINGPLGSEWAVNMYDRWYTVTDLLNPDTGLEAGVRLITSGGTGKCINKPTITEAFKCNRVSDPAMARALWYYKICPLEHGKQLTEEEDKIATEDHGGSG